MNTASDRPPLKHRLLLALIPAACLVLRLLGRTLRVRVEDPHGVTPRADPGASIYTFWHEHDLVAIYTFRDQDIQVLVSRSRDGEYLARAIHSFGYGTVRSSSSSGRIAALRGLARQLNAGRHTALTPDGPRGPRRRAQPGAVYLAAMTGRPVVPFGVAVDRPWRLRSWDRFEIPRPFSRARVIFGEPMRIPRGLDDEAAQRAVADLERRLEELDREAASALRRDRGAP